MEWADRYRDALADLARPPTPADGIPADAIAAAEGRLGVRLPDALRDYYLVAGRLDQLNRAHNRLYSPDEWFVDDGHVVFMEENQVVVFWGVEAGDPGAADPPVWQGVNVTDQPIEWHPEHERCSDFLVVMLYWQAVCGGMESAGLADISSEDLVRIRGTWPFVGRCQDLWAFGRDGQAACVIGEGKALQLFVGGRTEQSFAQLEAELATFGVVLDHL